MSPGGHLGIWAPEEMTCSLVKEQGRMTPADLERGQIYLIPERGFRTISLKKNQKPGFSGSFQSSCRALWGGQKWSLLLAPLGK